MADSHHPVLIAGQDSEVYRSWDPCVVDTKKQNEDEQQTEDTLFIKNERRTQDEGRIENKVQGQRVEIAVRFLWHEQQKCHKAVILRRNHGEYTNMTQILLVFDQSKEQRKSTISKMKRANPDHFQSVSGKSPFRGSYFPPSMVAERLASIGIPLLQRQRLHPLFSSKESDDIPTIPDFNKFMEKIGFYTRKQSASTTLGMTDRVQAFRAPQARMTQNEFQSQGRQQNFDSVILQIRNLPPHRNRSDSSSEASNEIALACAIGSEVLQSPTSSPSLAMNQSPTAEQPLMNIQAQPIDQQPMGERLVSDASIASPVSGTVEAVAPEHSISFVPEAAQEDTMDVPSASPDDLDTSIANIPTLEKGLKRKKFLEHESDRLLKKIRPVKQEIDRLDEDISRLYEEISRLREEHEFQRTLVKSWEDNVEANTQELTTVNRENRELVETLNRVTE